MISTASWHAGWPSAKHDPAPEIQVYAYNDHTVILRQNKSVLFEAPFMFLLFGNEQAVLVDTGATAEEEFFPLRRTVDGLITGWLKQHPREGYGRTLGRFRLYVQDWSTFRTTIDRLIEFSAVNPVTHILGCHIEMSTTPGQDYPRGWNYQPDEPPLEMDTGHLHALRAALDEVGDRRGVHPFDDFIIYRND